MNFAAYLPIIMLVIIVFITTREENHIVQKIRRKHKKEENDMFEFATRFIGQRCIIYTFNTSLMGVITEVNQTAILIEENNKKEIINLEYIVRIQEYPEKKKKNK